MVGGQGWWGSRGGEGQGVVGVTGNQRVVEV